MMAVGLVGCSEQESVAPPALRVDSPSAAVDPDSDEVADTASTDNMVDEDEGTVTAAKPVIQPKKPAIQSNIDK